MEIPQITKDANELVKMIHLHPEARQWENLPASGRAGHRHPFYKLHHVSGKTIGAIGTLGTIGTISNKHGTQIHRPFSTTKYS